MQVNGSFRFHSVGQGLFYTGILNKHDGNTNRIFTFVYDCGSKSPRYFLDREIEEFKQLLPKNHKKIDLLIVSHLHDDHVNGLDKLLDGLSLDTVVMPYVNHELRFLAKLESRLDDDFLLTFYNDPVDWFVSHGAENVLLVGDNGEESNLRGNDYSGRNNTSEIEGIISTELFRDATITYLKRNSSITKSEFDWIFRFENLRIDPLRHLYRDFVNSYLGKRLMSKEDLFKSGREIKALRNKMYCELKGSQQAQNRTSVVLLHRPNSNAAWYCQTNDDVTGVPKSCNLPAKDCRTLLTGDIDLHPGEMLELFHDYPKNLVFQYPHHGAKGNHIEMCGWNTILSYGIANTYGHPSTEVMSHHQIVHVTERNGFNYHISFGGI